MLYAGNLGAKQGLELLLNAAKRYSDRPDVKFFVVGHGAHRDRLEVLAKELELSNLEFKPLAPWCRVPEMLAAADVHVVLQRAGAADAVMPSKLTNILSAGGNAVVTAEAHTELGRTASEHPGIYNCVRPENVEALIRGIEEQISASDNGTNKIAREYAQLHIKLDSVLARFKGQLYKIVEGKKMESGIDPNLNIKVE